MAVSKNSNPNRGTTMQKDRVLIKFVRKARQWARTEFTNGKQVITWHETRPVE